MRLEGWAAILVVTFPLSGETQAGLCSYQASTNTLLCSNLTTLSLATGGPDSMADLRHLEVVDSKIGCLHLASLAKYRVLRRIRVVWSQLRSVSCHRHRVRHRKDIHQFR